MLLCMAVYPLAILDTEHMKETPGLRLLVSGQLVTAVFGSILALAYTLFLWFAALTGMYQVDTYSGLLAKENPRKKLQRAAKLSLKEQIFILFGTTDWIEILDTWQYGSKSLPLTGLEWTFLHSEGGITTSDEDDELEGLL